MVMVGASLHPTYTQWLRMVIEETSKPLVLFKKKKSKSIFCEEWMGNSI